MALAIGMALIFAQRGMCRLDAAPCPLSAGQFLRYLSLRNALTKVAHE